MDFCVSLIFFLNSKKNGEKSPAKITKSTKLRQFVMSILKGLNSFLKNILEKKNLHFIILYLFLNFFLLYEHPKGTKHGMKHENPLFFKKRFLCKKCWICCKNSTNVAKKFPTILWYRVPLSLRHLLFFSFILFVISSPQLYNLHRTSQKK